MNARVPTLPTPTTLRAASTIVNLSNSCPAVVAEGGLVDAELLLDCVPGLLGCHLVAGRQVSQGDDDGWSADDAIATVDDFGELGQRAEAVAGVGLAERLVRGLVRFRDQGASSLPAFEVPCFFFLPVLPLPGFAPATEASLTARIASCMSCSVQCAYQMSSVRITANSAMPNR